MRYEGPALASAQQPVAPGDLVPCQECRGDGWRYQQVVKDNRTLARGPMVCQACKGEKYVPILEWPAEAKDGQ